MDLTMQMKSAELLMNFLRHDTEKIPLYGFVLQKERFVPKENTAPLERSTPEAEGVPSGAIERFYKTIEAQADTTACHAITILRHGKVIAEGAYAPYRLEVPHMLYSMSKSVTGLAVGIASDEGYLDINERLVEIFPEYVTNSNAKILKAHTLRHLLTMSSGIRFNEVGSGLDENWMKMFMQSVPKFEAGTEFDYNSLNSYVLAAAVVKRYDVKGKTYFKYPNKYYYTDIGLRNARLNYRQYDPGHIMENIIYNELLRRGYSVDVGVVTDRTGGANVQKEIDFVVNDADEKIMVRMDIPHNFYDDNGIFHCNLIDLLLGRVELF